MKIFAFAIAALASTVEALRLNGEHTANVEFTTQLMANAVPYGDRNLANNNNNYNGNVQITGAHSIIFKSCESLRVDADLSDDNDGTLTALYEEGSVRAQKSYILFDVCLSSYCDSGKSSDRTTYITDIASFINALVYFIPSKQAQYCDGCQQNSNYCLYGNGNSRYSNGGNRRHLEETIYEYIDCNRCKAYNCFTGYSKVDYSLGWIQSMTQCQQSQNPFYFNGLEVTMGFMCNQDGSGVEVATFLDDDCTLYTNQIAYGNIMSEQDYLYYIYSKQHIEYMFTTDFSCYDPQVVYINPTDEAAGYYNFNQQSGDDALPEAAEWCQLVFQANMDVVDLKTCGGTYSSSSSSGSSKNSYLAEADVQDGTAVCSTLQGHGGKGDRVYDKKSSGSMYKYSGKQHSSNWGKRNNGSGGLIAFFVIVALAGAAGGFLYLKKKKQGLSWGNQEPLFAQPSHNGQMA